MEYSGLVFDVKMYSRGREPIYTEKKSLNSNGPKSLKQFDEVGIPKAIFR